MDTCNRQYGHSGTKLFPPTRALLFCAFCAPPALVLELFHQWSTDIPGVANTSTPPHNSHLRVNAHRWVFVCPDVPIAAGRWQNDAHYTTPLRLTVIRRCGSGKIPVPVWALSGRDSSPRSRLAAVGWLPPPSTARRAEISTKSSITAPVTGMTRLVTKTTMS